MKNRKPRQNVIRETALAEDGRCTRIIKVGP